MLDRILHIVVKTVGYGLGSLALLLGILIGIVWLSDHRVKYEPGDCVQSISDGSFIVRITSASWWSGYSFQYWNVEGKAWEPSANGEISTYFNDGRLFNSSALYVKIVCPFGDQRYRK